MKSTELEIASTLEKLKTVRNNGVAKTDMNLDDVNNRETWRFCNYFNEVHNTNTFIYWKGPFHFVYVET